MRRRKTADGQLWTTRHFASEPSPNRRTTGFVFAVSYLHGRFVVKVWSLKRSADYGSKHIDEHSLKVAAATLAMDKKTVFLKIPELHAIGDRDFKE